MSVPLVVCSVTSFEHPFPLCSWMSVREMADAYVIVCAPDFISGEDRRAFCAEAVAELQANVGCPVLFEMVERRTSLVDVRNVALRVARDRLAHLDAPFLYMLDADQVWEGAREAKEFIGAQDDAQHILFPFRTLWRDLLHEHVGFRMMKDSYLYRLLPGAHYRAHQEHVEALYLGDTFYIHRPDIRTVPCPHGTCWEFGRAIPRRRFFEKVAYFHEKRGVPVVQAREMARAETELTAQTHLEGVVPNEPSPEIVNLIARYLRLP